MIYLDNAATTAVLPEVAELVIKYMTRVYGNPSSLHHMGLEAEKAIKNAGLIIAEVLATKPEHLIYTSGGTESNNLVILNPRYLFSKEKYHFITSQVEHPSVSTCFKQLEALGHQVTYLPVDAHGKIFVEDVIKNLKANTRLISIMMVNNEIGTINPIAEIASALKKVHYNGLFHTDATQAIGKIEVNLKKLNVDLLSCSAHKFHGPKGVGLLYNRLTQLVSPTILGGGQQKNQRSGTYNVPGIIGLAKALQIATKALSETNQKLSALKAEIFKFITDFGEDGRLLSPIDGAPHIISLAFKHTRAEVLLHALEKEGIYVSSGSACSSTKIKKANRVLSAMGVDDAFIDGAIRISTSSLTEQQDLSEALQALSKIVPELQKTIRKEKYDR